MKWFEEVFLPSLFEKKKMVHGKVCTYITDKQAHICRKYMTEKICNGDYGQFSIYEHKYNECKIQLCESGKYNILYW